MRALILALLLAACASPFAAQEQCVRTATRALTWSDAAAPDTMTARSAGRDCATADISLTIANSRGETLVTSGVSYAGMNFGDLTENLPTVSEPEMDAFLEGWLGAARTLRSSDLPDWPEGAPGIAPEAEGARYETELSRNAYLALRARALPVLCFDVAMETAQCYAFDPEARGVVRIAIFGI